MPDNTDTQNIIDIALAAARPHTLDPDKIVSLVVPGGATQLTVDLEKYLPTPRRKTGHVHLHDASSLIEYVKTHAETNRTSIYADLDSTTVTAVLNGHVNEHDLGAGWGDHRASLTLRKTPNWQHWAGKDRTWMSQVHFAEHVEEGLVDIEKPPAAEMLEMAQTFQATARVAFKSSTLLHNGQRQIAYEETIESKAGQKGNLTVPTAFTLGLIPFEGQEQGYKIMCRLQTRISGQELAIRYLLDRPQDILKTAFGDVTVQIGQATNLFVYSGTAPNQ